MRKESGSTNLNTYITDHLPAKFQEQRKLLLPYYKEAKKNKKKNMWKAIDRNYTLFINKFSIDNYSFNYLLPTLPMCFAAFLTSFIF